MVWRGSPLLFYPESIHFFRLSSFFGLSLFLGLSYFFGVVLISSFLRAPYFSTHLCFLGCLHFWDHLHFWGHIHFWGLLCFSLPIIMLKIFGQGGTKLLMGGYPLMGGSPPFPHIGQPCINFWPNHKNEDWLEYEDFIKISDTTISIQVDQTNWG